MEVQGDPGGGAMSATISDGVTGLGDSLQSRAPDIYQEQLSYTYRRRNRVFAWIFIAQWILAIALSLTTWQRGGTITPLYSALFLGAVLLFPSLFLIRARPGALVTSHVVATVQMLWSWLLSSLASIELDFYVFVSLAFLAFHRDWRILITATLTLLVEYLLMTLYGGNTGSWPLWEHIFWLLFEDAVLILAILESQKDLQEISAFQAESEELRSLLERKVEERTEALSVSYQRLESTQKELHETSKKAGLAEITTGILHNVGNVLNSVNVSAGLIAQTAKASKSGGLQKALALLQSQPDPAKFLAEDPKGKKLIDYFALLSQALDTERERIIRELDSLTKNIDHIKVIVTTQQSIAKHPSGNIERFSLSDLVQDACKLNGTPQEEYMTQLIQEIEPVEVIADPHQILQILVNLLANAKHAVQEQEGKKIIVRVKHLEGQALVEVQDDGVGISKENLEKIFRHGFTTKKEGHGFGLHSCVRAAKEMGGSLTAHSAGEGHGATFSLYIPLNTKAPLQKAA